LSVFSTAIFLKEGKYVSYFEGPPNRQNNSENKKVIGLTIQDFKTYYKFTVSRVCWWHIDRLMKKNGESRKKQNKIKETPHIYVQLTFERSTMVLRKIHIPGKKNEGRPLFIPYIKIS
jgi:hypothetical protein